MSQILGFKKKAIVGAIAGIAAMAAAAPASAYVYASSRVFINSLSISTAGLSNASAPTYSFTTTNTATLPGGSVIDSDTCGGTVGGSTTCGGAGNVLNSLAQNAPGSTIIRPDNNFTYFGPTATDTFANSDSLISSAELVTFVPTATSQIAETLMNGEGTARANAEITSNTSLSWTLTVTEGGSLVLRFQADPSLRAAVADLGGAGYDAQANINASFTLSGTGSGSAGTFVRWAPTGTTDNDCIASGLLAGGACAENNDQLSLNANVSTGVNPSDVKYQYDEDVFGLFGVTVTGLKAGTYSLALNVNTSAVVTRVPEPASIALLGIAAMAGAGVSAVRRRKARAV